MADFLSLNAPIKNESQKSLFVQFPKRIPKDKDQLRKELKALCPLVKRVKRPRQPRARYCFCIFATPADCLKGLDILKKTKIGTKRLLVQQAIEEKPCQMLKKLEKQKKKEVMKRAVRNIRVSHLKLANQNLQPNDKRVVKTEFLKINLEK